MKPVSILVIISYLSALLSGCVSNTTGRSGVIVGPGDVRPVQIAKKAPDIQRLEVIIPVMNPGLAKNPDDNEKKGIWPELRRAEANRFAVSLKTAMDKSAAFGAIRVTPNQRATGDLYVLGKIIKSNGEDVEIAINVIDISGRKWLKKTFKYRVKKSDFRKTRRNKDYDIYTPIFTNITKAIISKMKRKSARYLATLPKIAEIRFAADFSKETFAPYLKESRGRVSLKGLPAADDPMLKRIRAIRVRDQLFIDKLQNNYENFNLAMNESYHDWQKQSWAESRAARKASGKSFLNGLLGVLAVGAAIAMASKSNGSNAATYGAVAAGTAGAMMISNSFQKSKEAKIHREALSELGSSLDIQLASQVMNFEKETVKLTGNAADQFSQWRKFLKKIYNQESGAAGQPQPDYY